MTLELRHIGLAFDLSPFEMSVVKHEGPPPCRIICCEGHAPDGLALFYQRRVDPYIDPSDHRLKEDPLGVHFEVAGDDSIFFVAREFGRWHSYGMVEPGLVWTMVRGLYCLGHPAFSLLESEGYLLSAHERLELLLGYRNRAAAAGLEPGFDWS